LSEIVRVAIFSSDLLIFDTKCLLTLRKYVINLVIDDCVNNLYFQNIRYEKHYFTVENFTNCFDSAEVEDDNSNW
jgi:hypothetical protein